MKMLTLRIAFAAAALTAGLCAVASAQAPAGADSDAAKLVGAPWEMANADRDKVCDLTFKSDRVAQGFKIEFDAACGDLFPIVKDVAAWKFAEGDLLRLVDRSGKTLIEFGEVETGVFEAPTPGVGLLFLQAPGSDGPPSRQPDEIAGEWTLMRGGRPACMLVLGGSGADGKYPLTLRPGCEPDIAQQSFASWSLESGELLLAPARGAPWRFEEIDASSFRRVPSNFDITLTR